MTIQEISTPSTVTECSHGLKEHAKEYLKATNYIIQSQNSWLAGPEGDYVPDEVLQGLWEWYQKAE